MPSVIGYLNINNNSSGGIVEVGDCLILTPKTTSKFYNGSGSYLVGNVPLTASNANATIVNDSDAVDASVNTGV